jgi:hypothetical protein
MIFNFSRALSELAGHEVGGRLLASAPPSQLARVATWIADDDLGGLATAIGAAADRLGLRVEAGRFAARHIEHLLWCEQRKALWRSGRIRSRAAIGLKLRLRGRRHLRATARSPTILISPMVASFEDVLWILRDALGERRLAVYGEGLSRDGVFAQVGTVIDLDSIALVGSSTAGTREILRTLAGNGVFVTYPDFVYAGHKAVSVQFLGMAWPFSSSFISLCARGGTMLLPGALKRDGDNLSLHFEAPVEVAGPASGRSDPRWSQRLVGATVARLLERLILSNPEQWALLTTVVAQCHQRATA